MHYLYGIFSSDLVWTALKWTLIALIWLTLAYGLYKEDRDLKMRRRTSEESAEMRQMLHMQHQRNRQVVLLITLILMTDLAADMHRDVPQQLPDIASATPEPAPAAATPPATAAVSVAAKDPQTAPSTLPFTDITEFNEKDSKEQAYLDGMKQRYEAWLVTFYYLQQCHKAGKPDFELIRSALENELTRHHADKEQESNIISAAVGSYQEMYHDIPCDGAHLDATQAAYDANMQRLKAETVPEAQLAPAAGQ